MHVIRLRGPWQQESRPGGIVRYSRRFHKPTGLEGGERVWLVIDSAASGTLLNNQPLAAEHGRCDVTELLAGSNFLVIEASELESTDGLARLEIG